MTYEGGLEVKSSAKRSWLGRVSFVMEGNIKTDDRGLSVALARDMERYAKKNNKDAYEIYTKSVKK